MREKLRRYYVTAALWVALRVLRALLYIRAVWAWWRGGLKSIWHIGPAAAAQMAGLHQHIEKVMAREDEERAEAEYRAKPSSQEALVKAQKKRERKAAKRHLRAVDFVRCDLCNGSGMNGVQYCTCAAGKQLARSVN